MKSQRVVALAEQSSALTLAQLTEGGNLAELLDETTLASIGLQTSASYVLDESSREAWRTKMAEAIKLALQVVEAKTFPWPNASNVKFPLLTIAALQYHSRAYPALVAGYDIVKCVTTDESKEGEDRADRIERHMSYQLLEEDAMWEDQMDKVLLTQPIMGCAFKKTYYDPGKGHNVSEMVLAQDLVVPYFTKSLEDAERITHVIYLSKNAVHERIADGRFLDVELTQTAPRSDLLQEVRNTAQGTYPAGEDASRAQEFLEQHCFLDLDQDGYAEPYIVTVHKGTSKVVRIVARFYETSVKKTARGEVIRIEPEHFFTKFPFIPSPDGGFYDLGFGVLLGPVNETINSIVNQLIDSGTLNNTAGGFLGRGAKIKSGDNTFRPWEWKRCDATGDDLRKSIFPLPVREPSQVLFSLLELLIGYGERIAGATETLTGASPGQNTPAETSRNVMENGLQIFRGILKRTYRAFKDELRKAYALNSLFLVEDQKYASGNGVLNIFADDYLDGRTRVFPSADPELVSDSQRVMQATATLQLALQVPGHNMYEVVQRYYRALRVKDIESIYPDPQGPRAVPPKPDPRLQVEQAKLQAKQMDMETKLRLGIMKMQQDAQLIQARIVELHAKAMREMEEAKGVKDGHMISLIQMEIAAARQGHDQLVKNVEMMQSILSEKREVADEQQTPRESRPGPVASPPSDQMGMGMAEFAQAGDTGAMGP